MSAVDTSQEIAIGRDWPKSLVLILLCVFVLIAFTWIMFDDASGYRGKQTKSASYVIVPVFAVATPWVIFRLFWPFGPLLRISPDGFADRRVSSKLVPWSEISNIVSRSEFVTLTMSRRFAKTYPISLGQRILKRRRKAGPCHLVVAEWCMAHSGTSLESILASYREAYGNRQRAIRTKGAQPA